MAFYRDRIFPRIMNLMMNTKETRRIRAEVCAPLKGEVVEIGFGTGLNLPHIPPDVTRLLAVDPMERGRSMAQERLDASPVPVEFVGLDGESLPIEDQSVDAVLATWTLCSIADPVAAVREVKRVLKPGGTLHFVEHGRSESQSVQKWQYRLDPIQKRLAGGCHLSRPIDELVTSAGFEMVRLDAYQQPKEPKPFGWFFEGIARKPA